MYWPRRRPSSYSRPASRSCRRGPTSSAPSSRKRPTDVDIEAFADGHEQGYSVVVETFDNQGEVRPLLREALDLIFTLKEEPVEYMAEVCAEIEAAHGE